MAIGSKGLTPTDLDGMDNERLSEELSKAKAELGWEAEYDIQRMCVDSWRWQSQNPNGYDD